MILLLTCKEDTHPTPVIEALKEFGVELFRLNTEALLTDYDFWWGSNDEGTDFYLRDIVTGREIYGHDVTAVWERRPENPEDLRFQVSDAVDEHNLAEARGFLNYLLYYVADIYSIGNHDHENMADSKFVQMKVAQSLGIDTPVTIFSNSKRAICDAPLGNNIIIKPIYRGYAEVDDDTQYVFYGQKVSRQQLLSLPEEAFSQTVTHLQSYIDKKYELRVTVVGHDVFAAKIDSQFLAENQGKTDWRQGYDYGLKYEAVELPDRIKRFCRNYLQHFKLNFGAFDFIVTPDDQYVFLECNPNGQWYWIELSLPQLKIAESIARHLIAAGKADSLMDDVSTDIDDFLHQPHDYLLKNEDDFKIRLADYLRSTGKYDNVIPEYYVDRRLVPGYEWNKRIYIDIIVERNGVYVPIELKYKTKRIVSLTQCMGRQTDAPIEIVKSHGAHPYNRYLVWKDVHRLEHIARQFPAVEGGIVLFVTNDAAYLKEPGADNIDREFSLAANRDVSCSRHWHNTSAQSKEYPDFEMFGSYSPSWHSAEISFAGHSFDYLIFRI